MLYGATRVGFEDSPTLAQLVVERRVVEGGEVDVIDRVRADRDAPIGDRSQLVEWQ
jgi:hypothetical protein